MQNENGVVVRMTGGEDAVAKRRNELVTAKLFRLSFQAHRLFLYVLSKVEDDHTEHTGYSFSVYEMAKVIGVDRNHLYKEMINIVCELERAKVRVPVLDDAGHPTAAYFDVGLIRNAQKYQVVMKDGKEQRRVMGDVTISLNKELLPYVRRLKERYTEVELKYVFRLTSGYAQKLYDLLKAHAFKGRPWRVSRDELWELMAIEPGKFQLWGDFRRYVIELAQKEINDHTDLPFDVEYIKSGKMVTEIEFRLRRKIGQRIDVLPGTQKHEVYKGMTELGLTAKQAAEILAKWWDTEPERVIWHLSEARKGKQTGKIANPIGWFRSGIKRDFRPQRSLFGRPAPAGMTGAQVAEERRLEAEEKARDARLRARPATDSSPASIADLVDRAMVGKGLETLVQRLDEKVKRNAR